MRHVLSTQRTTRTSHREMLVRLPITLPAPSGPASDGKQSAATLADVGKAVVGVLKHPEETRNRAVYVQTTLYSQNQLLEYARKKNPDLKTGRQEIATTDLLQEAYAKLQKGDFSAFVDFIFVSLYSKDYGGGWSEKNDNALLGIKEISPKELEKLVASYV